MTQPPDPSQYRQLIELAQREDLGRGDITSEIAIPYDLQATARVVFRQPGILAGLPVVAEVLKTYDPKLQVLDSKEDTTRLTANQTAATIAGPLRSLLAAERVLLNFLQRLSAIATRTAQYVDAIAGTNANIYDTRKTTPGWRALEKYAVRCGGGRNHRQGLYDAVLIKDNHLARLTGHLQSSLDQAVAHLAQLQWQPEFIEIEVDNLDQLAAVLQVQGVNIILLDNMTPDQLRQAVTMRNQRCQNDLQPKIQLEASGNITLETVRNVAETGVERISIGALTHSVQALDIGLDMEPQAS